MSAPIGSPFANRGNIAISIDDTALAIAQANASGYDDLDGVNLVHNGQDYIQIHYSWEELYDMFMAGPTLVDDAYVTALVDAGNKQELIDMLANADVVGGTMLVRGTINSRFMYVDFTVNVTGV